MIRLDLSPEALARIAPGLSLQQLGSLVDPPLAREHLCRIRKGAGIAPRTVERIEAALTRARLLAQRGELQPVRKGRPRNPGAGRAF